MALPRLGITLRAAASVLACALAAPVAAQATLAQALEQAWRRLPQAQAQATREREALAAADVSRELTPEPPALSIASRNDRLNRNQGQQEYEVELAAPLWLPGQQAAQEALASSQGDEVVARAASARWELAGTLREAWWSLAAARLADALAARRLETAQALAADVQRRFQAGDLSRIDANLARAEVHAADAERIESAEALKAAEQAYQQLVGANPPERLAEEVPAAPSTVTHPQLALAAAASRSARDRVRLARESVRAAPEIALRMVRERGDFVTPYANSVGVRLTIPLSSAAKVRRDDAAASAEAEQADAEVRAAQQRVAGEQTRARDALAAASRLLAGAQARRALSVENLQLSERAFALGETDLASLLRIRAAAYDAEALLDRQHTARAAAISRLNQALGVLP